jgi:hypothetical protein
MRRKPLAIREGRARRLVNSSIFALFREYDGSTFGYWCSCCWRHWKVYQKRTCICQVTSPKPEEVADVA